MDTGARHINTMDTLVVGLGYKARQGKDYTVKVLVESYKNRYDIRRYAFADELKREVNELDIFEWCMRYGVTYDTEPDMSDPMCQTRHGKQSRFLQWYGTEYRRARDPFYWVRKLSKRIEEEQPQIALISDMRFGNEFIWVKAVNGYTVKVTRHGFIDISRDPNHPSETALDGYLFDYEIVCGDGDLEELRKDALYVMDMIVQAQEPIVPDIPGAVLVEVADENKRFNVDVHETLRGV